MFNYKTYLIFLFASLGVSIALQMLLPFPYGLIVAIGLFVAFPVLLRRQYMNRMRGYGRGSTGGGGSGSGNGGGGFFGFGSQGGSGGVRYVCLVCSNRHRGGACPRCGSKMQRADF